MALLAGLRHWLRKLDFPAGMVRHVMVPSCDDLERQLRHSLPAMGYNDSGSEMTRREDHSGSVKSASHTPRSDST